MSELPRIFVASSTEALPVAEEVNIRLEHDARVRQWDNAFDLSSLTLPSLVSRTKDTDFAVFVFHKDDKTIIRDNAHSVVRDNVLFELGLFVGSLGIDKCFVLVPKSTEAAFRLPTDLAGLTVALYDDTLDDMVDAVATSCAKIKQAVRKLQASANQSPAASTSATPPVDHAHLQTVQSELWRARIDLQRAVEQQAKMQNAIATNFFLSLSQQLKRRSASGKKALKTATQMFPSSATGTRSSLIGT